MPTWDDQLGEVLRRDFLPGQTFTLDDVLRHEKHFAQLHPENNNVGAKLRQTLQHLRDKGAILFLGKGVYRLVADGSLQVYPDEVPDVPKTEGKRIQVYVNRYEREPKLRDECIAHFGAICQVCEVDMSDTYGDQLGAGFVHVHHRVPLAVVGESETDPKRDLVPVCPNCHAMLHRKNPPLTVEALHQIVHAQRSA